MAPEVRLRAAAAGLTLASGALMMYAGYVGARTSWAAAGAITIPGGILILGALAVAGRADLVDGDTGALRSARFGRMPVMAVVLLAGGVMIFAGYAAAVWTWALAPPLATLGGLVIGMAFMLNRRAT